jgi:hypothetical protein
MANKTESRATGRGQLPEWATMIADNFGSRLTEDDAARWYDDLKARYNWLDNSRLTEIVRWATNNVTRPERAGRVTVLEVVTWIKRSYKARNTESAGLKCAGCGDKGWIPYAPSLGENGFTFREYNMENTCVIPCACTKGRQAFQSNFGAANTVRNEVIDEHRQMEVARKAMRQRMEYNRIGALL